MKKYEIQVQGKPYTIQLKSFGRIAINDTVYSLRSLPHRNVLFFTMEYDLPIPEGEVLLASGMFFNPIIVDGVNQTNGKPYTPIGKVPFWAYIFMVLDLSMCLMGGAIPAFLAVMALFLTLRVSVSDGYPLGVRLLLSVVILAGGWLLLLFLAYLISMALY